MKFNFKEVAGGFEDVPTGRYTVEIMKLEEAKSAQKGTPMLKAQYKIVDGSSKGRMVFDQFVLQPNTLWKIKSLLKAAGSALLDKECSEKDIIKEMVGKKVSIYVETTFNEEFNKSQSVCSNYAAPENSVSAPTTKKTAFQ